MCLTEEFPRYSRGVSDEKRTGERERRILGISTRPRFSYTHRVVCTLPPPLYDYWQKLKTNWNEERKSRLEALGKAIKNERPRAGALWCLVKAALLLPVDATFLPFFNFWARCSRVHLSRVALNAHYSTCSKNKYFIRCAPLKWILKLSYDRSLHFSRRKKWAVNK